MAPMTNLAKFYWARYEGACQDILHGRETEAYDTCYDLLLQPELSSFLRALVNCTLATGASVKRHPNKMIFVDRARAILVRLRTLPKEHNSDKDLDFLEQQINLSETNVREELQEIEAARKVTEQEEDNSKAKANEDVEMKDVVSQHSKHILSPDLPVALPVMTKKDPSLALPTPPPSSTNGHGGNGHGQGNGTAGKGH